MYVTFNNPAELTVCKSVYYALKMKKLGKYFVNLLLQIILHPKLFVYLVDIPQLNPTGISLSLFHNTTDNRYSTAPYDPHPLKQTRNLGPYPYEKRVIPIIKGMLRHMRTLRQILVS